MLLLHILNCPLQSLTNVSTRSAQKVTVICMANPPEYSAICTLSGQILKLEPGETSTVQVKHLILCLSKYLLNHYQAVNSRTALHNIFD